MMSKRFLLFTLLSGVASLIFATWRYFPHHPTPNMKSDPPTGSWEQEWKTVDSLEGQGLYKQALERTDLLATRARTEQNGPMHVKAVLYVLKYTNYVEENPMAKDLERLQSEMATAAPVEKCIFHSFRAELYWNYFQQNQWSISQRTETVNFDPGNVETWDLKKLLQATLNDLIASLEEKDALQRANLTAYAPILVDYGSKEFRPTVYDILAHKALDILQNEQSSLTQPADRFEVKEDWIFGPTSVFATHPLTTSDTLNFRFHTLTILQGLESFHANDANPSALVEATLKRLAYVKAKSIDETKDSLYLHALEQLDARHKSHQVSTQVLYAIAIEHQARGGKYDPHDGDEWKGSKRTAWNVCKQAEARFPGSYGAQLCEQLRLQLESHALTLQGERVVPINKPSRTLLSYTNVAKVHQRVVPVTEEAWARMENWNHERIVSELVGIKPIWTAEVALPADDDLNGHSAEIAWPELKTGQYVMIVSANPDFGMSGNGIAYERLWVSDLAIVPRQMRDGNIDVFVTDRNSGKPLQGVTVTAQEQKYDYTESHYRWHTIATLTTDANGICTLQAKPNVSRSVNFIATFGGDKLRSDQSWYQYRYNETPRATIATQFFTDRSIYRPGQTIYFKGIVLETSTVAGVKGSPQANPVTQIKQNFATTVTFYNTNNEVVSSVDVVTNDFGTFQGTFTAPQGVLNGQMRIADDHGNQYFAVEDYKRPKFEVTVDPVKEAFRLGDKVTVKGKAMAYAGSNIDGAEVKYRVVRQATFPFWSCWYWWRPYPSSPQMEIAHGETTTKADGTFSIDFMALPDKSISKTMKPQFNYRVIVDVVDITGETRSGTGNVNVGYVSLSASIDIADNLDTDKPQDVFIRTSNLNGQPEAAKGTIAVYALQSPGRILRQRLWERPDKFVLTQEEYIKRYPTDIYDNEDDERNWKRGAEVWKSNWQTTDKPDSLRIPDTKGWAPGKYVVELLAKDKFGEEVKLLEWITVRSGSSGKMALPSTYEYNNLVGAGEPGEKASFSVGTSYSNAKVLYEVWHRRTLVSREWLSLSDEVLRKELLIEEKHRGNFGYALMMVRDGRFYSLNQMVSVPWTNKELDIEVETFRDKLQPGAKEEWKIILKGHQGDAVAAELLAGMYDASLDAFRGHSWYLNTNHHDYMDWYWQSNDCFGAEGSSQWTDGWNPYKSVSSRQYDQFNYFGFAFYYAAMRNGGRGGYYDYESLEGDLMMDEREEAGNVSLPKASAAAPTGATRGVKNLEKKMDGGGEGFDDMDKDVSTITVTDSNGNTPEEGQGGRTGEGAGMGDVKVRTNLNETAFFFPQLRTNEKGEVVLTFTMPEALTRWKFMLLGHTQDLKVGQYTNTLVTQKDLMVMPNAPRFMREGDRIWFTAKVTNLTQADMAGNAQLELMDALTGKSIDALLKNTQATVPFTAAAGQSAPLSWELTIPEGVQAITWRVKAKAGNFTDGEESSLPVLTNRMLVTETMPLPVRPLQTRTFNFDRMTGNTSTTLRHHKYTLEFTSNPAWYAIQALPYMMEYPYECSEQTFSRFYANSIAAHVANSHPRIKSVFDSWKNTDKQALLSNLEKNQELKYVLLEETPWVMDAADEGERKQRVGLLFDLNRMSNEQDAALRKLQQAQVSNGAWPWFPGMPESEYITRHIVCGMGHLDKLGVRSVRDDKRTWKMVQDAIGYLDIQMKKDYDWIMAHATDPEADHLGYDRIHYMYARSFFLDVPIRENHQKAYDYFLRQEEKYWNNRLDNHYTQAMMSLSLSRNQRQETAMKIIKSLGEMALHNDEMGMYWKKEFMGGWSWYQAPIEEQSLLIEAFGEVANDMASVEEMKIWLLKQKQTQDWKTTRATAEACYALLLRGTDFLAESGIAQIKVGKQTLDPMKMENVKVEAGTGYFKTSWAGSEITKEMGEVTVTNPNKVVSWGAVYWQYFEQLDKITSFKETGVKIDKQLFLTQNSATGPVITPITSKTSLKPGDLIKVRIEIRCDRDMDYVHMKDMRASGFEPVNVISRYKWQDGLGYYESTRDAATNFFFERLPKGTWVFEYPLRVNHRGDFSNGITTLQCMYAPEFTTHSEGIRVLVR
jgi:hypothetical protein